MTRIALGIVCALGLVIPAVPASAQTSASCREPTYSRFSEGPGASYFFRDGVCHARIRSLALPEASVELSNIHWRRSKKLTGTAEIHFAGWALGAGRVRFTFDKARGGCFGRTYWRLRAKDADGLVVPLDSKEKGWRVVRPGMLLGR